jgi:glutamate racemase
MEPCPGWATRVETLALDDPRFTAEIASRVTPLLDQGVDQLVLGCTHYSFLAPVLKEVAGNRAQLVDVADAIARQVVRLSGTSSLGVGSLTLLATARPERLQAALPRLGLNWLVHKSGEPAKLAHIHSDRMPSV